MKRLFYMSVAAVLALATAVAVNAQGGSDIVGTWDMVTVSPEGDRPNTMVVTKEGEKLKGVAKSERGELAYDSVEVKGSDVTIVLTINFNGTPMVITYIGKIDKTKMGGTADFGGLAEGTWSATKK